MKSIKRIMLSTILLLLCLSVDAYDVCIDGIYYNLNTSKKTAIVTYKGNSTSTNTNAYTGNVVIPETIISSGNTYTVTEIGGSTFNGCSSMTSLTIPKSLKKLNMDLGTAFNKCTGMSAIYVASGNTTFTLYDGCLYTYLSENRKKLVYVPAKKTSISFDPNVVTIGTGAASWTQITSVSIPSTVTEIKDEAFYHCENLSSVTVPSTVVKMGYQVFGWYGYSSCCPWYTSKVNSTSNNRVIYIGKVAYSYKGSPTSIILGTGTLGIASNAFMDCTSIKEIAMDNTLEYIGPQAFDGCTSLTSVSLSTAIDTLYENTFYNCKNLKSITIPDNCKAVKNMCFYNCVALTTISLGSGLESMDFAFSDCPNINDITSYAIVPPTAENERIDFSAFDEAVYTNAKLHIPYLAYKMNQYSISKPWSWFTDISYIDKTYTEEAAPHYVDLGLPSGTLWADVNVGAISTEDPGDYFAWGETTAKESYAADTYKYGNSIYSKYNNTDKYKSMLRDDDAAYCHWGSKWTVPTEEQMQELLNECTWTWTRRNGINGFLVSRNYKSIFLPAAGVKNTTNADGLGKSLYYRTKTLYNAGISETLAFDYGITESSHPEVGWYGRSFGGSIRPVAVGKKTNLSLGADWTSTNHADNSEDSVVYVFDACEGDYLYFRYEVDCETENDGMVICLDGVCHYGIWDTESYDCSIKLSSGHHRLTVRYIKDGSYSEGADCGKMKNVRILSIPSVGDVNLDAKVDVADIANLIDIIQGKKSDSNGIADVDGDGIIDKTDVTKAIYSIVLENK